MSSNISFLIGQDTGGFLSEYIEESVERPADGQNGECVIHYGGQHSDCEMHVKLENGKKEGEATILKNGQMFMRMEYKDDALTGSVERMNGSGQIDLKGNVENGVESGIFQEYNGEELLWKGYYRNGKRYSDMEKSSRKLGWYEERSVETRTLLSIAKYDDEMRDKEGRCMEYKNGEWIGEWIYEKGKRKRVIREYRNGVVTLYDSDGNKTYEGELSRDEVKDGFYGHEPVEDMKWYCKEVDSYGQVIIGEYDPLRMKKNGRCFELESGEVKRVCLYEMDRLVRVVQEFNGAVMTEYDENGTKVYEGEFTGDMSCGFFRNGKGKELNRIGMVKYNGNWVYGHCQQDYLKRMETIHLYPRSTEFETDNDAFGDLNETVLALSLFPNLKRIHVGNGCFRGVRILDINGLNNLNSIEIGEHSFSFSTDSDDDKKYDGCLRIVNCARLQSIHIMGQAFEEYYTLKLENLPSLETFTMDGGGFAKAPLFSLTNLPKLKTISVGCAAFVDVQSVVLENLPQLETITLGHLSMFGDRDDCRMTTDEAPYDYKNMIVMRNLPSLTTFNGGIISLAFFGSITLDHIPNIQAEGIELNKGCLALLKRIIVGGTCETVFLIIRCLLVRVVSTTVLPAF